MALFLSWVVSNVILAGLLAALAFLAGRFLKNPHVSHGLWLLVLIKLLTPPLYVWETSWFQEPDTLSQEPVASVSPGPSATALPAVVPVEIESDVLLPLPAETTPDFAAEEQSPAVEPVELEPAPGPASLSISLPQVILMVWISGTVLCGGLVLVRCLRFRRLLALASPADDSLQSEALRLSKRIGLKHGVRVDEIDAQIPPLVWGLLGRPRILVPRKLFADLSNEQRQAVLAHELAHIWRKDHFVRWIEVGVLLLFWWYPVAWWASRGLRRAEEECCDALVIWAFPESRQTYAHALCKTLEFLAETRCPIPAVAGGTLGGPPLKRRIEMIMHQKVHHRMTWKAWLAMLLVAAVALPIMAQNQAPEKPRANDAPKADIARPEADLPGEEAKPADRRPQEPAVDDDLAALPQNPPDGKALTTKVEAILEPSSDLKISSLHGGTIVNVNVSEGDLAKQGQILVEVQNTEMEIRLQETLGEIKVQEEKTEAAKVAIRLAQANLEQAKAEYTRAEQLMQRAAGSISQAEFEQMKARLHQAELGVQKAELEERALTRTLATLQKRAELAARLVEELVVKAPVDGVVLELKAKAGELVKANDQVARIVRFSPMMAVAHVPDPEGLLGQTVQVEVHSRKGQVQRFAAKVTFVDPFVNAVTQRVKVRALFKNTGPDGEILVRPGQSASLLLPE